MIKFERATLEDGELLTKLKTKTFDDDSRRFFNRQAGGPPGYNSLETLMEYIENYIYYKIIHKEEVIGAVMVIPMENDHFQLSEIYISPEHQNKGIGQKTIEFIESEFPTAKKWSLDTPSVCTRNHYLYKKMGYRKVDEILLDESSSLYLYLFEK